MGIHMEPMGDFSKSLSLRPDHAQRPIWICPNHLIYLEVFHPSYKEAYDFLIAIANPISRTHFIHSYKLNQGSLYAAVSIGLETQHILNVLDRLSKVGVPAPVADFISSGTTRFGKVKIVLRKNGYFLESFDRQVLQQMLDDPDIRSASLSSEISVEQPESMQAISFPSEIDMELLASEGGYLNDDAQAEPQGPTAATSPDGDLLGSQPTKRDVYSFEIDGSKFVDVKRRCIELDYPLLEEYDFNKDSHNPSIPISLKPTTTLRKYQEKALSKMFNNGRVRSGIISLPCGAGKTLVGIVAGTTIKKRTLVLCTGGVSVQQWAYQFKLWSSILSKFAALFCLVVLLNLILLSFQISITITLLRSPQGQRPRF
jgi:DNA excision repair protein ERCC-3